MHIQMPCIFEDTLEYVTQSTAKLSFFFFHWQNRKPCELQMYIHPIPYC